MTYVSPSGKYVCNTCRRRRQRVKYEAQRQRRLKERRRRIAARRRPGRVVRIWAAGHFEGEGTFSIARRGNHPQPIVSLTSTDKSMVDVFHDHWPGYLHAVQPRNPNARVQFTWTLLTLDKIEGFILDVRAYLKSARMRAKAALLLEDVRARAELRRTDAARARAAARHMRMRALNRRGVRRAGEDGEVG